ncbi:MAG: patatin-like phospholipase family protein [Jatrophihabitantaceae bacterium]
MDQSTADTVPPTGSGTTGRRTAFVFQGGGSLSAPQVGMLRALTEAAISPDFVIGTSAGALNAVAFATEPGASGVQRLEDLWLTLRRRNVARISVRNLARAVIGRSDGLLDSRPLIELLQTDFVPPVLSDTAIPAYVVATELMSGEPIVLSDGDTTSALLASSAFPGIFPPVQRGSLRLIDGGVGADIPVLQAEALGAEVSYVLPAAISDERTPSLRGPLAMAYHALGQILESTARRDAKAAQGEVYLLPPAASSATNPLDFRETRRLIDDGYRLTQQWLAGRPSPVDSDDDSSRAAFA